MWDTTCIGLWDSLLVKHKVVTAVKYRFLCSRKVHILFRLCFNTFQLCLFFVSAMSTPEKPEKSKQKAAKSQEINYDSLLQSVKACLIEKKGIRLAAREYGIIRSTLQRYTKKVTAHFDDVTNVKDDEMLEFLRESHLKVPSNMVCLFLLLRVCLCY